MFSHRELQVLISGADHEINVTQLRQFTIYGSGYDDQHPTVVAFWEVFEEMTEAQKRKLLKFVTSCSKPPLLGFKAQSYRPHVTVANFVILFRTWILLSASRTQGMTWRDFPLPPPA